MIIEMARLVLAITEKDSQLQKIFITRKRFHEKWITFEPPRKTGQKSFQ